MRDHLEPKSRCKSRSTANLTSQSPSTFFRHVVLLRRLQGIMFEDVNLVTNITDPEAIFVKHRNQIDEWWESVTHSPTGVQTPPETFLELNYHLLLVNLYRPSRLFPQTHL